MEFTPQLQGRHLLLLLATTCVAWTKVL